MKKLLFLFLLLFPILASAQPMPKAALGVSVDSEPYCKSDKTCIRVLRVPNKPKLITIEIFNKDSVLLDKLVAYSTKVSKITGRNVETLLKEGSIIPHGEYWRYDSRGRLERRTYYKNGIKDSVEYSFLPGEKNYTISRYHEGVRDSTQEEYRNGLLVSEHKYFYGIPGENRILFDGGGRVRGSVTYDTIGNKLEAKEFYVQNGQLKRHEIYEKDSLISVVQYAPTGEQAYLDDMVFERRPFFKEGRDSLLRYVFNHVKYPPEAYMIGLEGIVLIQAEIDKDGTILYPEVIPPAHQEFKVEALRLVKEMPKWEPGVRYWDYSIEKVVIAIPFFMNHTFDGVSKKMREFWW